jgi:hypothetical protein
VDGNYIGDEAKGITLVIKPGIAGELILKSADLVLIRNPSIDSIQSSTADGPLSCARGITLVIRSEKLHW